MSETAKENATNTAQNGSPPPLDLAAKPRPVVARKPVTAASTGLRTQTPSNRSFRLTGTAQRVPVPASEGPVSRERSRGLPASMDIRGLSREDLLRRWKEEKELQTPKKLGAMTPKARIEQWRKETGGETPRQAYRAPVVVRTPRFEAEVAGNDVDLGALRAKMEEIVRTKEEGEEVRLALVQLGSSAETPGVQHTLDYWLFRAQLEEKGRNYEEVVRLFERAALLCPPGVVEAPLRAFLARMQAASRQHHKLRFTPRDGGAYLLLLSSTPTTPTPTTTTTTTFRRCEEQEMAQYWAARLALLLSPLLATTTTTPTPTPAVATTTTPTSPLPASPRKALTPSKLTGRALRTLEPLPAPTSAPAPAPTSAPAPAPTKGKGKGEGKEKAKGGKTPLRRLRPGHVAVLATPGRPQYDHDFPALPSSPEAPQVPTT